MLQCDHVKRSGPLFQGHVFGGASLGQCEEKALPGFVVCFEHVNKEALWMRVQQLESENRKLKKEILRGRRTAQTAS